MTPTPEIHAAVSQHIAQLKSELGSHLYGGVYLNFLEGKEARERSRQGYSPETIIAQLETRDEFLRASRMTLNASERELLLTRADRCGA